MWGCMCCSSRGCEGLRRERWVGHFLRVPRQGPERPLAPPATYGNGLPTTPDASGGCACADAISSSRTVCRIEALARARAPATCATIRRDDPVPSSAKLAKLQASTILTRSERDGDANPVGSRRRAGRSGQPGGHGGIRIPVALAQHQKPEGFASPSCLLSAAGSTQTANHQRNYRSETRLGERSVAAAEAMPLPATACVKANGPR
jgi:hypothetical protein